jgi:hypothetical protein
LLGMPHKSVDKLTFEDFIKVKDRLVAQEVQLQELNNRAAGELPGSVVLRPILLGANFDPGARLSPRGEFCPLGRMKLSPGGEILCSHLHSSKQ